MSQWNINNSIESYINIIFVSIKSCILFTQISPYQISRSVFFLTKINEEFIQCNSFSEFKHIIKIGFLRGSIFCCFIKRSRSSNEPSLSHLLTRADGWRPGPHLLACRCSFRCRPESPCRWREC